LPVAHHDAPGRIEHAQALRHVVHGVGQMMDFGAQAMDGEGAGGGREQ
jgi:hypothetical protein